MKLRQAHQILIGSAIVLALLFAVRSGMIYLRTHVASDLVLALFSLGVALGLGIYLRRVRAKWAETAER